MLIGNWAYKGPFCARLDWTIANTADLAKKLRSIGFEVVVRNNLNLEEMKQACIEYSRRMKDYDLGLFYFSGHGAWIRGMNCLTSVDFDRIVHGVSEDKWYNATVHVEELVSGLAKYNSDKVNLIIIEACRADNFNVIRPMDQDRVKEITNLFGSGAAAVPERPRGMVVSFACSMAESAYSTNLLNHSVYTYYLTKWIDAKDVRIEDMLKHVRVDVDAYMRETYNNAYQQITWDHFSLFGELYLNPSAGKDRAFAGGEWVETPPAPSRLRTCCPGCGAELIFEAGANEKQCPFCRRSVERPAAGGA